MANFQPMKQRLLCVMDRMLEEHEIGGSFLDYGCGRGDVAAHLARSGRFVSGTAYDPGLADEHEQIMAGPCPVHFTSARDDLPHSHDLAVLFDVIEHIGDPNRLLEILAEHTAENAWLCVTVPYNPREWGVDDEFYGHLRRLSRQGMIDMLERGGWRVIRMLDPSFPSFWLIRRCYLWRERISGNRADSAPTRGQDEATRSLSSSRISAWGEHSRIANWLSRSTLLWTICRKVDVYLESIFWGFEAFALCRKAPKQQRCGVCRRADLTFAWSCPEGSVWSCPHCRSQRLEARAPVHGEPPQPPVLTRFFKQRWERMRTSRLAALLAPAARVLEVRSGPSAQLLDLGRAACRTNAAELPWDDARLRGSFDAVIALHALERIDGLDTTIDVVDAGLHAGGFLEVEFFSARSLIHWMTGRRWTGYDWNDHRSVIDPISLADFMGLRNYRLVHESQMSWLYSPVVAVQSLANLLMPWQRNSAYDWLKGRSGGWYGGLWAGVTVLLAFPLALVAVPIEVLGAVVGRGSVVRQLYRKAACAPDT